MIKKDFESELFNQTIKKGAENYEAFVKAELLYRIKKLEVTHCSCRDCSSQLSKYAEYYNKLEPPPPKLVI